MILTYLSLSFLLCTMGIMAVVLLLRQTPTGIRSGGVSRPRSPKPGSLLPGHQLYMRQRYTHPHANPMPAPVLGHFLPSVGSYGFLHQKASLITSIFLLYNGEPRPERARHEPLCLCLAPLPGIEGWFPDTGLGAWGWPAASLGLFENSCFLVQC